MCETAHAAYLAREKRNKRRILAAQIGLLILLLLLWETAARLGWIDDFITSSPTKSIAALLRLARDGSLARHLLTTLWETVIGFTLGTVLGTLIAALLWWFPRACRVLEPYLVVLNALPKVALGPIIIVWMGAGMGAIITMALFISVVVTVLSVLSGFLAVDPDAVRLMRTFGANRRQIFRFVVFPSNIASILSSLKINVGMSFVGVIMGEFLVSKAGLGYLIVYGGQVFRLDLVMGATGILCLAAALLYGGVALLEKRLLRHI